jgi:hypothetical protein
MILCELLSALFVVFNQSVVCGCVGVCVSVLCVVSRQRIETPKVTTLTFCLIQFIYLSVENFAKIMYF